MHQQDGTSSLKRKELPEETETSDVYAVLLAGDAESGTVELATPLLAHQHYTIKYTITVSLEERGQETSQEV
jgi:hypothetical protein